jgi:hypothetical protein
MARISKPIRGCCYPHVSLGLSYLICKALEFFIGVWAYLVFLPLLFWFHLFSPIDTFDLWLRKYTRDNYWLMTNEGNEWLEMEKAEHGSRRTKHKPG